MKNLTIAIFTIIAITFNSCTKQEELIIPETKSTGYKLIEQGKHNNKIKYRIYDMGTYNSAVYVEVETSRGDRMDYIVQANDNFTGWEVVMPDDYTPAWCWECWGECIEATVDMVVDEQTAVSFAGAALCPECAVGFVIGVAIGCTPVAFN